MINPTTFNGLPREEKIKTLLAALENADVITVDDSPLLHSGDSAEIIGEPENQIFSVNWHDDEGLEFGTHFTEENFAGAKIENGQIYLEDYEGEPTIIRINILRNALLPGPGKDVVVVLQGGLAEEIYAQDREITVQVLNIDQPDVMFDDEMMTQYHQAVADYEKIRNSPDYHQVS